MCRCTYPTLGTMLTDLRPQKRKGKRRCSLSAVQRRRPCDGPRTNRAAGRGRMQIVRSGDEANDTGESNAAMTTTACRTATAEQRQRLRAWCRAYRRFAARWRTTHPDWCCPAPVFPFLPLELAHLLCGAMTRAGTPCRRHGLFPNRRCRLHGGRSTGPRSVSGKQKSAANGRCPKRARLIS